MSKALSSRWFTILSILILIHSTACINLEDVVTNEDNPTMDEVLDEPDPPDAPPQDPALTQCDEEDFAAEQSGCGSITMGSVDVTAGDVLTVTVNVGCGGGKLSCDYASPGITEVDGIQAAEAGGYVAMYSYDPPKPTARNNGSVVQLSQGQHTVRFFMDFSAPNDCLRISPDGYYAEGPWVVLGQGGGQWSSVAYFRIRQSGI